MVMLSALVVKENTSYKQKKKKYKIKPTYLWFKYAESLCTNE